MMKYISLLAGARCLCEACRVCGEEVVAIVYVRAEVEKYQSLSPISKQVRGIREIKWRESKGRRCQSTINLNHTHTSHNHNTADIVDIHYPSTIHLAQR